MNKLIALVITAAFAFASASGYAADTAGKGAKKPAAAKDAKKGMDDQHKSAKAKAKSKSKN